MPNFHKISSNVFIGISDTPIMGATSDSESHVHTLLHSEAGARSRPAFRSIFSVGEALPLDGVVQHTRQYGAQIISIPEYYRVKTKYWLEGGSLHNPSNQILLFNSPDGGKLPLAIDFSLNEGVSDLKSSIKRLFLISQISPICIHVNSHSSVHVESALDIALIISVLNVWFSDLVTHQYYDSRQFSELLLRIFKSDFQEISRILSTQ